MRRSRTSLAMIGVELGVLCVIFIRRELAQELSSPSCAPLLQEEWFSVCVRLRMISSNLTRGGMC